MTSQDFASRFDIKSIIATLQTNSLFSVSRLQLIALLGASSTRRSCSREGDGGAFSPPS
jgi:hypothetical protein